MLPSGNDAAHALAEYFGAILKKESDERELKLKKEDEERAKRAEERRALGIIDPPEEVEISNSASNANLQDKETNSSSQETKDRAQDSGTANRPSTKEGGELQTDASAKKLPEKREPFNIKKSPFLVKSSQFRNYPEVLYFLEQMNKYAEDLGLKCSQYDSPHGLSNYNNKTTALDIAKLSTAAMQIQKFKDLVGTKFFTVKKNSNGNKRTYKWYNTHLMLGQRGINGIKTGVTPSAGPCLCTSISLDGIDLIVVIVCTKNMDIRWPETWKLANWAMHRLRTIEKFQNSKTDNKSDEIQHKRLLNRIRHL